LPFAHALRFIAERLEHGESQAIAINISIQLLHEPWPSAKASSLSVMPVFCYGYVNGILAHIRFDEQYDRIFHGSPS